MKMPIAIVVLVTFAALNNRCAGQEPTPIKPRLSVWGREGPILAVAFSPDGKTVASTSADLRTWDSRSGKSEAVYEGNIAALTQVAYLPNGSGILTGSGGGTLRLWDATEKGKHRTVVTNASGAIDFALSPDGASAAVNYSEKLSLAGDSLCIVDLRTGQVKSEIERTTKARTCQFSPDGKTLASSYSDGTIRFWDVATGKLRGTIRPWKDRAVTQMRYSPDGRLLAVDFDDGPGIKLWDVEKMREGPAMAEADQFEEPAFSPDGRYLAAIGIAYSPDGKMMAAGTNYTIRPLQDAKLFIWDLPEAK